MFKRLRLQLTALCACGTAVVLVGMAAASLTVALSQLQRQSRESFRGNINTVLYYLQAQTVVDQTWLTRTEADNSLWIRIESEHAGMQYTRQSAERQAVTAAALSHATGELGFVPFSPGSGSLEAESLEFELIYEGRPCFGCVARVPRGDTGLLVVLVKDRTAERTTALRLWVGFGIGVIAAVAALVAFSWLLSGRAVRPVEENNRRQVEFVSAASHELRSPLSVIELSAGTIRNVPASTERMVGKIEGECRRMAGLISDLLLLASADSERWGARLAPVSLKTALLATWERYEPLAEQAGIHLELDIPDGLPQAMGDLQRIEQLLAILLDNALRFTPAGGSILLRGAVEKASVCCSVSDSGPGIPQEEMGRVFDRFYQADHSRRDKEHYGLGLSIAREIAALHRGRLVVRRGALGGAEFVFQLRSLPWQE